MATKTSISAKLTLHYPSGTPSYTISGLHPEATDEQIRSTASAVAMLRHSIPMYYTKSIDMELEK